jgi:D-amino-acid dehydrogenase
VDTVRSDVAVVGGGLVGLSLAYELVSRGATVTVVDAGLAGRATDAGAGILSPATTADPDPAWWKTVQAAGAHYPELLARLERDGADTAAAGYDVCGLLSIGLRPQEDDWFQPFVDRVLLRSGHVVHEIRPDQARSLFPPLGEMHRALYNPEAARIDGRGMAAALREGARARGVTFVDGRVGGIVEARGVGGGGGGGSAERRSVERVVVDDQVEVACGAVAVTGGAWSAAMGVWLECPLPIAPTKGQIVHLGLSDGIPKGHESGSWPIAQPLLTHYIVPWPGARVACGGTFETNAGFNTLVTASGVHELLRECLSVAPGLAGAEYLYTRVGLRPTSADDRPVVGQLGGWEYAWVATGHGANGLLLGPCSSKLLAHGIIEDDPSLGEAGFADAFDPARFY